jgi:hypothetical protein
VIQCLDGFADVFPLTFEHAAQLTSVLRSQDEEQRMRGSLHLRRGVLGRLTDPFADLAKSLNRSAVYLSGLQSRVSLGTGLNFADTAPELFARQELGKFELPELSCWVRLEITFPGDGVRR